MPNPAAAALIAERLPKGLVHPGDDSTPAKLIPLPGLNFQGLPEGMRKHFANEAGLPDSDAPKLVAEAIVSLLETDGGFEIVPKSEITQLRDAASTLDAAPPGATVTVYCPCSSEPALMIAANRPQARLTRRITDIHRCN